MSVGLLVLTHNGIGQQLLDTASCIFAEPDLGVDLIAIPANLDPANLGGYADLVRSRMEALDSANGTLVMTDLFGATPDNLARYFADSLNANVISGVNLPMIIKVYCNRTKIARCVNITCRASL